MSDMLSKSDVKRLLADPSTNARADTARKVAVGYGEGQMNESERALAEQIFEIMVRDTETRVREQLAENLKECPFLPSDVAKTLANDIESVSLPMIQYSSVLSDEDLIEIVRSSGEAKQEAVAGRARVSSAVSDALVESGSENAVAKLMTNAGAEIKSPAYEKAISRFQGSDVVKEAMAKRDWLPVEIAERLVNMVSSKLHDHIQSRHLVPTEQVSDLILQARENATLGLMTGKTDGSEVRALVRQLRENDRLTPSIILRALCMGDMRFFETAIAIMADVPEVNARILIHDDGRLGLKAILEKSGIPRELLPAFQAAVEVSDETEYDGGDHDRERFRRRMIERILTSVDDTDAEFGADNIEYLMGKLAQIDPKLAYAS